MDIDNEKLFEALDRIAYVNREGNFAMLPEDVEDEMPFLLSQLKLQLKKAIDNYISEPKNEERTQFYGLAEKI